VDFYCHELLLVIEVDGSSHDSQNVKKLDVDRQTILENLGVSFIRFEDEDVINNLENVINEINNRIAESRNNQTSP